MSVLDSRTASSAAAPVGSRDLVDPRGLRFGAAVTVCVLAAVLVTMPSPLASVLLVVQVAAFGLGAVGGVRRQPYGILFRTVVRPSLRSPVELEDAAPPRFAQVLGLVCATVGLLALVLGLLPVAYVALAAALAAAALNAAFDLCLGCELYLLAARLRTQRRTT